MRLCGRTLASAAVCGWCILGAPSPGLAGEKGLFITGIAVHPSQPETVFALTTYAVGLLKSVDRGRTWSLANRGIRSYSLYRLAIDPRNPDVVYIGAGGGGLYVSLDGGGTFTERNDGLGNTDIGFLTLHPAHPDQLYVVTSTGVYRSPDRGRTWSAWNEGDDFTESQQFQDLVIVTGTRPETFLLASKRGVFMRRVGDASWTLASPDLDGRRISALARHPNGREVFAAVVRDGMTLEGGGLYVSRDTGATWRLLARELAEDWVRVIRFHPRDARIVYVATSGRGVLRSADGGRSWNPMNEGLSERDIRALVFDPVDPARLYAGTHGGGVFVTVDGGRRWVGLDRVPDTTPDEIIAGLKAPDPSRPPPPLRPPASFAKCNGCHGWTDPLLNQTAHSLWLMPANRRDWGRTVRRMSGPAKLTIDEQTEIIEFLTGYSNGGVRR